ncbi:hypothetical protein AUR64_04320 [Haloprofundus marisrubri]|uniref:MalT-like winged helix domain-containing protein n=1 Tax=Haloprofundus marisrubri TaxID=1514971 RepID=A0A0W1RDG9_9EURY|nr:hypothetical protein [Haloprofundus marisrubri]KTG11484.1 hypothetical protein AUR64_04320 [Haloprofundus marisrubri]
MVLVRTDRLDRAHSKIVDGGKDIHISGQPGIGKTEFLEALQERLSEDFAIEQKNVRIHHSPEDLHRDLLHLARRAANERDSKPNQLTTLSGGIGPVSGGIGVDDRVRDPHKLEDLTRDWSGNPLILCVDNIHKIADDENIVRGIICELSDALGEHVHLITAGQISINQLSGARNVEEVHLNLYTIDETRFFLEHHFGSVSEDTVKNVYAVVEGHPLFLSLLTEASDNENDLHLPEGAVFDTIEERYIDGLPRDMERFLRQVAPLPELNERTCSGIIEDLSPIEADQILRELNRRVIVQQVYRTDNGDNIYKIHHHFREFLVRKHQNEIEVHRTAFQYHIQEQLSKLTGSNEDALIHSLPHSIHAGYHLKELHGDEPDAETFIEEIDRLDITYPERGIVMMYSGFGIIPTEIVDLWQQELTSLTDWVISTVENEHQAQLITGILEWALSQFNEKPLTLEDVQIEGSIDDLPVEFQSVSTTDLSEEHAKRFQRLRIHCLRFFLIEEPYQSKVHREYLRNVVEVYGITPKILFRFRSRLKVILLDSELGNEFENLVQQYAETVGEELQNSLSSSLDFYNLRDQMLDIGQETFDNVHYKLLLNSGLLEEIAHQGGEILEEAENPVFAMFWYSLFTAYFRSQSSDSEAFETVKSLYLEQLEERKQYEQGITDPIINAEESAEKFEIEEPDAD